MPKTVTTIAPPDFTLRDFWEWEKQLGDASVYGEGDEAVLVLSPPNEKTAKEPSE